MTDNRMSRTREALILFGLIFIITSVLYIELAETAWYPIKQHIYVDKFSPYIINRKVPFEHFYFAFKHFHSYYLSTFFIITSIFASLYYYLSSSKRGMSFLKFPIIALGMFMGGFLIFSANRIYWFQFSSVLRRGFLDLFLNYLHMLFSETAVILLFVLVTFACTMFVQFLRLRKIEKVHSNRLKELEGLEEPVKFYE